MADAEIAQREPYEADVEEGKTYFWCACGKSASQPYCDGSHKDTDITPVQYKAERTGTVYFCGCKQTHTQPMCDGTHTML